MKLPPTEAALLVNVKIYMTRADEILSDKGIMMLSKITQLQNLLCRMARVTPESLDRVLAGPLEIIKFDKERREMEAQEQREEVARQRAANGEESGDEYVPIKSSKKRRATGGHEALKTPTKVNSGASNYVVDDDSDDVDSTLDASVSALVGDIFINKESPGTTDTPMMTPKAGLSNILQFSPTGQKGATNLHTPLTELKAPPPLPAGLNHEIAIYSQDKDMMRLLTYEFHTKVFPQFPRRVNPERLDDDIDELMLVCQKLNFDTLKYRILEFAERRMKNPNKKAKIADLTDSTDPSAIFHAIQISAANEVDARLHRIYCQIRLVAAIDKRIRNAQDPRSKERLPASMQPSCLPGYFLDELADQMCEGDTGDVRRKIRGRLRREHNAGRQWLKMFKELGGEGVALVFCFAEISSKAVVYEFTDFQRACIAHVVRKLPSIQNLITAIGSGTLESFCRLGHLTNATMDRIRECNGPEVIYVGSDGEGDGGDGEGDRGLSDFEEKGEGEVDDGGVFMEVDG